MNKQKGSVSLYWILLICHILIIPVFKFEIDAWWGRGEEQWSSFVISSGSGPSLLSMSLNNYDSNISYVLFCNIASCKKINGHFLLTARWQ